MLNELKRNKMSSVRQKQLMWNNASSYMLSIGDHNSNPMICVYSKIVIILKVIPTDKKDEPRTTRSLNKSGYNTVINTA